MVGLGFWDSDTWYESAQVLSLAKQVKHTVKGAGLSPFTLMR